MLPDSNVDNADWRGVLIVLGPTTCREGWYRIIEDNGRRLLDVRRWHHNPCKATNVGERIGDLIELEPEDDPLELAKGVLRSLVTLDPQDDFGARRKTYPDVAIV